MTATGTQSGRPVTYTAAPAGVCEATGENGARIDLVGVGQCTVTAHQAEYLPVFLRADDVSRSFEVAPADLTITADNKTRVYGADEPTYTASVVGLANGDAKADLGDLTFAGAAPDAGVGSYVITVSGATNPNYDITYATGTEKVTPARLTITADDTTRVYGEDPSPTRRRTTGSSTETTRATHRSPGHRRRARRGRCRRVRHHGSGATNPNYAIDLRDRNREGHPGTADDHGRGQDPGVRRGRPGLHGVLRRVRQRRRPRRGHRSRDHRRRPRRGRRRRLPDSRRRRGEPQLRHRVRRRNRARHPGTPHHHRRRPEPGVRREGPGVHRVVRRPGERGHPGPVRRPEARRDRRPAQGVGTTRSRRPAPATPTTRSTTPRARRPSRRPR